MTNIDGYDSKQGFKQLANNQQSALSALLLTRDFLAGGSEIHCFDASQGESKRTGFQTGFRL